ncbi:RING finger protein [Planoprotostelium fungivorum]|uniref:RING finger protein n=1 Tax=Planoprotostelium fungivorum TaxID=1890364 RepID=A0A2P6NU54_9EUKA|nr:RING finger protein [Planoprotostelium fungivorum]
MSDAPAQEPTVCSFKKGSGRKATTRKRKETDESVTNDDTVTQVAQKKREEVKGPFAVKSESKKIEDFSIDSDKTKGPVHTDAMATAHIEIETEHDRDATAIRERAKDFQGKILNGEEAEKLYHGAANYKQYLEQKDKSGMAKGTGIRAGPIRSAVYARAISRIDYQPDLCKDYKETGYCGYGDSCKFMHDRGDYKNSTEIDREWEAEQKAKAAMEAAMEGDREGDEEAALRDVPFACSVCRRPFTDPIKTKCGHLFCELCALREARVRCPICEEKTEGTFKIVPQDMKKKLQKAAELYYRPDEEEAPREEQE